MLLGTSKRENVSRVLQDGNSQPCLFCIDALQTKSEESLTAFTYRLSELLIQCWGISPEHCRDKFKIDLFSYQLCSEKIARRVIWKHPTSVEHAFHITKEEEKELRILYGLSKDNVYSISEINKSSK